MTECKHCWHAMPLPAHCCYCNLVASAASEPLSSEKANIRTVSPDEEKTSDGCPGNAGSPRNVEDKCGVFVSTPQPVVKFNPDTHITGKVYDLTQENFNAAISAWESAALWKRRAEEMGDRAHDLWDEVLRLREDFECSQYAHNVEVNKCLQDIARLREALEYYACSEHYEPRVTLGGTRQPGVLTEGGSKAREALANKVNQGSR